MNFKDGLLLFLTVVFGIMYVNVGIQHFTDTSWFEPIVPSILGNPSFWVYLTGVIEIGIGVGLIVPAWRRYAGIGSAGFLVIVYWANLNMWVNDIAIGGKTYADVWHVLRLLAQTGMIALSLLISRQTIPVDLKEP
ncbi:MAG: DoxX family membrane protein [Candidatus Poseidonia sp.]|nr:DoxX family membrane protein [Poseidonia sp.]